MAICVDRKSYVAPRTCEPRRSLSWSDTLGNGCIDDIVMARSACEFVDLAGLVDTHRLDFAAGQHAGKAG